MKWSVTMTRRCRQCGQRFLVEVPHIIAADLQLMYGPRRCSSCRVNGETETAAPV